MNGKLRPLDRLFALPTYSISSRSDSLVSRIDVAAILRDYELEVRDTANDIQLLRQYCGTLAFVDGTHAHRIELHFPGMAPITGNDLRELFGIARQLFDGKALEKRGPTRADIGFSCCGGIDAHNVGCSRRSR